MGAVRELADRYLDRTYPLDPLAATYDGVSGYDDKMPDFSPEGMEERAALARATLRELDTTSAADDADEQCAIFLRDRLGADIEFFEAGEHLRPLNIFGTHLEVRSVFDVMPVKSREDWEVINRRIYEVPAAYASLIESLERGRLTGVMAARRQALSCAEQTATWAGETGERPWFNAFVAGAPPEAQEGSLGASLEAGAGEAGDSLRALTRYLREVYAPEAPEADAVGPDRYRVWTRMMLGADLDLDDAYQYGWDEVLRIEADMDRTAGAIFPGRTLAEVVEHLEREGEAIEGVDAYLAWLQGLVDRTIDALDGVQFDVPAPIRRVEVLAAPPGSGAAQYYTAPTADFSRPGRYWCPLQGRTRFPTWGEVSTSYHEAVPGHHLDLATARLNADRLSRYQTSVTISATVEGWALYAERLMDELGYFERPDYRLGYLDAQRLRAVRVVIDLGMHLELPIPSGLGFHEGDRWTPELGREFLGRHTGLTPDTADSEWIRYLGMPAQAIGYKIGERAWLAGREAARRARGDAFDLKAWHSDALALPAVGLDDLATLLPTL